MSGNSAPPQESPPDNPLFLGDLNDKFNKLNQDYQRIKSQNSILKKAVIQEQQKVAKLEKEFQACEQKLRQANEEIDILQFNNQRLTKRLTIVQEEIAAKNKDSGWIFGSNSNNKKSELDVLRAELDDKIRENADLHVQRTDLLEEIKQLEELHGRQATALKACVVAKQDEVNEVATNVAKLNEVVAQLNAEAEKQKLYYIETEGKLQREVQLVLTELNQSRKRFKQKILNPNAAPPSPLSVWRDNKHTRELIGTFKDLYYAVTAHWDTHLDKITLLRRRSTNPPSEQLDLIYKELVSTIPSLSTQLTHIADSLHQYLPVLFSKDALPNLEFADTLHRFVNTCKKWLSYQQLRHIEQSQGTTALAQAHSAVADSHAQALRALDRVAADREVAAIRSLCSALSSLALHTRALYEVERNEGRLDEALLNVDAQLLASQGKAISLLGVFAAKLDEYEALAISGKIFQEGEESLRLRDIVSHIIMLNNDINVATKEREQQSNVLQKELEDLKVQLKDLQAVVTKKEAQLSILGEEWSSAKDQIRTQTQQLEALRRQLAEQEKASVEKLIEQERALSANLDEQKALLEKIHRQTLQDKDASFDTQLGTLQSQVERERHVAAALREELHAQLRRVAELEEQRLREKDKLDAHAKSASSFAEHQAESENKIRELEQKLRQVETTWRTEQAEKAQQIQSLQRRLVQSEFRPPSPPVPVPVAVAVPEKKASPPVAVPRLQETPTEGESAPVLLDLSAPLVQLDSPLEATPSSPPLVPAPIGVPFDAALQATVNEADAASGVASPLLAPAVAPPSLLVTPLEPHAASGNADSVATDDGLTPSAFPPSSGSPSLSPSPSFSVSPSDASTLPSGAAPSPVPLPPRYTLTVFDEAGNQSNGLQVSSVDKEREQALRDHYDAKVRQLVAQCKASDTKAVQLFEQYSTLLSSIDEKEAERATLLEQIKTAKQELKSNKEDLESTQSNYNAQIMMLSDRVLELSGQISRLDADLSIAHGCKVACGKCKAWNTVEWLLGEGKGGQRCIKGNHPLATFLV